MKFVCDQCKTKYSIADEKVRRKVLKIRCKNCSHIIVVREAGVPSSELEPVQLEPSGAAGGALFEGGFPRPAGGGLRKGRTSQSAPALKVTPGLMAAPELNELANVSEPTRLSGLPDFVDAAAASGAAAVDDEWYLAIDGNQFGPMGFSELCSRVKRGEAMGEAYVWRDTFDEWLELQDVPELKPFLPRVPPPPPRGGKSGVFQAPSLPIVPAIPPAMPLSRPPATPYPPNVAVPSLSRPPMGLTPSGLPAAPMPGSGLPVAPRQSYAATSTLPPSPLPPPAPAMPSFPSPPSPATEALAPGDSGMLSVGALAPSASAALPPVSFSPTEPSGYSVPLPAAPAPARPTSSTPVLLKITAAAGVASLLCGVGLVAYFIFFDRPAKPRLGIAVPTVEGGPGSAPQPAAARPAEPTQEFQPMEISHSARTGRPAARPAPVHKESKAPPAPTPAPTPTPKLDDNQRRLLALYGKSGDVPAEVPTPAVPVKKVSGPRRQISANDILAMQRKHRPALTACYDRALKRDDSLAELKADVTVTIDDRGLVKNVSIGGVSDDELLNCLRKNIRYWAFQPMGEQTFRFPIVFRGS